MGLVREAHLLSPSCTPTMLLCAKRDLEECEEGPLPPPPGFGPLSGVQEVARGAWLLRALC